MKRKNEQFLDSKVTRTIYLPLKEAFHHTSAMGRFWQSILKKVGLHPPRHPLLDKVLCTHSILSDLVKHTESYIAHLKSPKETTTIHSIISATEEHYRLEVVCQKQRLTLLELRMSRCTDGLSVRASAPRHLWLSVFLTGNYSSLAICHI